MTNHDGTTSGGSATDLAQGPFAGWPLIEIFGVGPDGTCHCPAGANCRTAGKHPRSGKWQTLERTEPAEFRRGSNMGTLTGAPAGFWVLDIDEAGLDSMATLRAEHGALPNTRVHKTGGGTFHYFFNMPDFDVTNRRGRLPQGIDARGTGGQVVLPPSRSGKGTYAIVRDAQILDAPDWLLDLIRPTATEADKPVADSPSAFDEKIHEKYSKFEEASAGTAPVAEPQDEYLANYEAMVVKREVDRLIKMAQAATDDGDSVTVGH